MFWAAHLAPARHSLQVGARASTSRGVPWSALNRACSWPRSCRSVTARLAGGTAPGARVAVAGVLVDGAVDGSCQVVRAATSPKTSRQAARNPSRGVGSSLAPSQLGGGGGLEAAEVDPEAGEERTGRAVVAIGQPDVGDDLPVPAGA